MKIKETKKNGITRIHFDPYKDERGYLKKIYRRQIYDNILPNIDEIYISKSNKGVVRGLHFQSGATGQEKLIYCISGSIIDIAVNISKNNVANGINVETLRGGGDIALLIPRNFAHGIIALEDNTIFMNISPQSYQPGNECGIRWDSLGIDFGIENPIVSKKDQEWPTLEEYIQRLKKK